MPYTGVAAEVADRIAREYREVFVAPAVGLDETLFDVFEDTNRSRFVKSGVTATVLRLVVGLNVAVRNCHDGTEWATGMTTADTRLRRLS